VSGSSTHVSAPVSHEVFPARHGSAFVAQPRPEVQAVHVPAAEQTRSVPHAVPAGFAAPSTHCWAPVVHEVTPAWQAASGLVVQASPAVQEVHAPALQTRFVPQLVPFARSAPSTHSDVPVAQEVTPALQTGSGLLAQATPAMQVVHAPALQTRSAPQLVPFARSAPSTHTDAPVEQEVTPALQSGSGLVLQATPAAHAVQAPALQTRSDPQLVPFGLSVPSTHTDVPVEQEVTPALQSGSGLVLQATPAAHAVHAPALHTRFVPQLVPFASTVAESTH
jgi:hypothetical protein